MKTLIAVGMLVLSAGVARAAYLVELDGGDQMTVDSYWEEGDRIHLMQGGVDMIVPKSRVRGVRQAEGEERQAVEPRTAPEPRAAMPASSGDDASREELERRQRGIEKHLLRVQAERFESEARGDDPKELKRLDREFKRTQKRRVDVIQELRTRGSEQ